MQGKKDLHNWNKIFFCYTIFINKHKNNQKLEARKPNLDSKFLLSSTNF